MHCITLNQKFPLGGFFGSQPLKKLTLDCYYLDYQSAQSLLGIDQNDWILPKDLSSSFLVLTTSLLLNCKLPLLSWSLHALMTLHLFWVTILRDKALSFPNLNNFILSGLIGMWYDT